MSWFAQLFWLAFALVGIIFIALASVLISARLAGRQLDRVQDELIQKIRLINNDIAELRRHPHLTAAGQRAPAMDQPRHVLPHDRLAERPPAGQENSRPPSNVERPPPVDPAGGQDDAAAAALADRDSFRSFADRHGGKGHVLGQAGGVPAISDSDFSADLWAIPCPDGLLIYPGFNLRRTQSSLVADSGRLAEEWLGWLYKIETGRTLRAFRPALVASDWTVLRRGILQVPF